MLCGRANVLMDTEVHFPKGWKKYPEGVDIPVAFLFNRIRDPLKSFGNLSQKRNDFMPRLKRLKR